MKNTSKFALICTLVVFTVVLAGCGGNSSTDEKQTTMMQESSSVVKTEESNTTEASTESVKETTTSAATEAPTVAPTQASTVAPTQAPTTAPTTAPTKPASDKKVRIKSVYDEDIIIGSSVGGIGYGYDEKSLGSCTIQYYSGDTVKEIVTVTESAGPMASIFMYKNTPDLAAVAVKNTTDKISSSTQEGDTKTDKVTTYYRYYFTDNWYLEYGNVEITTSTKGSGSGATAGNSGSYVIKHYICWGFDK